MNQTAFPSLAYEDVTAAIQWLGKVFDLRPGLVVPGESGTVAHAELSSPYGAVVLVISAQCSTRRNRSPRTLGGTAHSVYLAIEDVDSWHDRAVAAGAEVFNPLHDTSYGREFCCLDPEGHIWTVGSYRPGDSVTARCQGEAQ